MVCGKMNSMETTDGSGWLRAYAEAPQILHEFAAAEDPDGLVRAALASVLATTTGNPATGCQGHRHNSVLELGCGTVCMAADVAAQLGAIWIGLDSSLEVLQTAAKIGQQGRNVSRRRACLARRAGSGQILCARAEQLPLADATFDAVIAAWMLSYMPPLAFISCLQECRRVLRPGGVILAVENAAHATGMPLDGRVDRLLDSGFKLAAEVETELRFSNRQRALEVTRFLMGTAAPTPNAQGCIPHRVSLLQLCL